MTPHSVFNRKLRAHVAIRRAGNTLVAVVAGEREPAAVASLAADGRIAHTVGPRYHGCGIERELVALLEADARAAGLVPVLPRTEAAGRRLRRPGLARQRG